MPDLAGSVSRFAAISVDELEGTLPDSDEKRSS